MSTEIYLGYPPENIKKWIKEEAERKYQEMLKTPLTFTAEEAGSTVMIIAKGSAPTVYLETSPTGKEGSWSDFTVGLTTITLANVGDKVYFRAKQDNERFATDPIAYNYFQMTGKITASGNLNTLLKADGSVLDLTGDGIDRSYCYAYMFDNCPSLIKAPELPATTLAKECYIGMFDGCTSLTQAPSILPATTLASSCYYSMFSRCSSLTKVPELPATTLASSCYGEMFFGCTSLTQAPTLPATILAEECYFYMFAGSAIPSFTVDMTACTSVPTLPSNRLFSDANKPYTVLVPASLYNEWIQATNWSTITSNIQAV